MAPREFFRYHNGKLYCEGLPLTRIAVAVATPTYVYSAAALAHNYRRLARASTLFLAANSIGCYAQMAR